MVEHNHWIPGYVLMFLVGVDARDLSLLWSVLLWQQSQTDHFRPSDTLAPIFLTFNMMCNVLHHRVVHLLTKKEVCSVLCVRT